MDQILNVMKIETSLWTIFVNFNYFFYKNMIVSYIYFVSISLFSKYKNLKIKLSLFFKFYFFDFLFDQISKKINYN